MTRELTRNEFKVELLQKLAEEVTEVVEANDKESLMAELADVEEVLQMLYKVHNINRSEVIDLMLKKRKEKGGFSGRVYLEEVVS